MTCLLAAIAAGCSRNGDQAATAPAATATAENAATPAIQALPVVKPVLSCEQLAGTELAGAADAAVSITEASLIDTAQGPFCKVVGNIEPTIGFEVDLPVERWTQRFLLGGCGGLCGMTRVGISNASRCAPALNGEFAVAGTDMGHTGSMGGDDEAAFGADPQKRIDFAYRANHQTTQVAKALIKAFYGQAPRYSYFVGCSDGGREALMEAQRFPDDFDGISAGAPAALFQVQNSFYHAWNVLANKRADGSNIMLLDRLPILHAAALAHCPTLSGVQDGLLQDPRACDFDPASVQCAQGASDTSKCLTAEEVEVARKLYAGPADAQGRRFAIGGVEPGSEAQWMLPASADATSMSAGMASRSLQYVILPSVDTQAGDLSRFAFDRATFERVTELAPLYNAANTDLGPFQQRGGKLILWHGWSDTSITPSVSIAYYQGVQKQLGTEVTDGFMRLFLLPGVGHCGGGDGYTDVDVLTPLMLWTEQQHAPDRLLTAKVEQASGGPGGPGGPPAGGPGRGHGPDGAPPAGGPGGPDGPGSAKGEDAAAGPAAGSNGGRLHAPVMASSPFAQPAAKAVATRPVFAYPNIARYTGQGDPNDAANYVPETSPVTLPQVFDSEAAGLIGPDNQKSYRVVDGKLVAE